MLKYKDEAELATRIVIAAIQSDKVSPSEYAIQSLYKSIHQCILAADNEAEKKIQQS